MLEKIISWLETFPLWGEVPVRVDYLQAQPGSTGLFPQGVEELSRQEDILGNVRVRNRRHFLLYWMCGLCPDNREHSRWLIAFESWVQTQSAQGLAPRLGDEPAQERFCARQGRLLGTKQTGTGRYAVTLTAEYTTIIRKGE